MIIRKICPLWPLIFSKYWWMWDKEQVFYLFLNFDLNIETWNMKHDRMSNIIWIIRNDNGSFEYFRYLFIYVYKYRVSHNTVSTSVFWISLLPIGVEIPSWTFFNSPFCVNFENIQFFIIRWNLDRDIGKILRGDHFKSQLFFPIIQ